MAFLSMSSQKKLSAVAESKLLNAYLQIFKRLEKVLNSYISKISFNCIYESAQYLSWSFVMININL